MNTTFLLGAGASIEADIPVAFEMTKKMLNKIESELGLDATTHMLRFIIGGLMFQKGIKGDDPTSGINIEDLFNTVNDLKNRETSSIAPFINSWHPLLERFENIRPSGLDYSQLLSEFYHPLGDLLVTGHAPITNEELYKKLTKPNPISSNLRFEQVFENVVHQLVSSGSDVILARTSEIMLKKLINMVWIKEPSKVNYLIPLLLIAQKNKWSIATLNYDNSIELAGSIAKVIVDTGIDSWLIKERFAFIKNSVHLIKLHGSINWELKPDIISSSKPLQHSSISKKELTVDNLGDFYPSIIFGGKNKLTTKGPFLALLRAFESQLRTCRRLIVIGYSFGDEHINDMIINWFNQSIKRKIIIIDPKFPSPRNSFTVHLKNIPNNRVLAINKPASEGISLLENMLANNIYS